MEQQCRQELRVAREPRVAQELVRQESAALAPVALQPAGELLQPVNQALRVEREAAKPEWRVQERVKDWQQCPAPLH